MTTLSFDVMWRDRGATRGMQQLGRETDKTRAAWAGFAKGAAIAGVAVAAAAVKFGKDSVKAYADAQTSQLKLQNAFAKFPALADTNINALRGLNTELAKKTKFDDDATASGQAVLAQFKLTGQQITQLTPLLQDYAAKTGKDLPTAATTLGKAVMGQGRALKAVGINFKDTGSEAGNFEQIMSGLRKQVGGFAELEGQTAAGRLAILQNQFGELEEAVGAKLVPALSKGVGMLTDFVGFLDKHQGTAGPLAAGIASVATSITLVVVAAKGIRSVSSAIDTLGVSAKGASIAVAGIGAAIGVATVIWGHYAKKQAEAKAATDEYVQALQQEEQGLIGVTSATISKRLADEGALSAAEALGLSVGDVTAAVMGQVEAQQRVNDAIDAGIAQGQDQVNSDTRRFDAAGKLADALGYEAKQYGSAQTKARQMSEATDQATKSTRSSGDAAKEAAEQQRKHTSAMMAAARAALQLQGSEDGVEAAVDDATKAVKNNGKTLDNNTEKGRSNREALRNLAAASLTYREKLIEQGAKQEKVTRTTAHARAEFIATAKRMGATTKEAREMADKFGLLDKKIDSVDGQTVVIKFKANTSWKDSSGVKWHVNLSAPSSVGRKASGGLIRGPGTSTSDSIPTMLSNGEFVVNKKSTDKHRSMLEAINSDRLPEMAKGGYLNVDMQRRGLAAADRAPGNIMRLRDIYARGFGERIAMDMTKYLEPILLGPSGGVTGAAGGRVHYKGGTFTKLFARNLELVQRAAHASMRIFQGGFRPRTSYSGTSHAGDAVDFQVNYRLGRAFRKYVGAAGDRTGLGNWSPHIHAVPSPSHGRAGGSAVWQYKDYVRRGGARQSMRSPWGLSEGGVITAPALIGVAENGPERVLSATQTKAFDRLVTSMERNGGASSITYIVNAPNYVGSTDDLRRTLVTMARRGELDVIKR